MKRYLIGKISSTHGIKGDLLIKSSTDFHRFVKGKEVFLVTHVESVVKIQSVKEHTKGLIVHFLGFDNINDVLKFKGAFIYTDEKPILEVDEYHVEDLIGKDIVNQNNIKRGTVTEVIKVPQGYVLRVDTENGSKLIPFNEAFITEIAKQIFIDEIEGLL